MNQSKVKLKPCPFCGAEGREISIQVKRVHGITVDLHGKKYWMIECLPCDANTGWCFDGDAHIYEMNNGKELAIQKWNRRI